MRQRRLTESLYDRLLLLPASFQLCILWDKNLCNQACQLQDILTIWHRFASYSHLP